MRIPLKMANLLRDVLIAWAESERARIANDKNFYGGGFDPRLDDDYDHPGTYWLEDFTHTAFHDHNLEGVAAHRLYAIGKQLLEADDDTDFVSFDNLLRSNRWHLFRRLRWQLYAEFPIKNSGLGPPRCAGANPNFTEERCRSWLRVCDAVGDSLQYAWRQISQSRGIGRLCKCGDRRNG